jgi:hypothetical protein
LSTKAFEYGDFESTSEYRFDLMLLGPAQHIPEIALGPSVNSMRTRQIEKLGEEVLLAGTALPGTHANQYTRLARQLPRKRTQHLLASITMSRGAELSESGAQPSRAAR